MFSLNTLEHQEYFFFWARYKVIYGKIFSTSLKPTPPRFRYYLNFPLQFVHRCFLRSRIPLFDWIFIRKSERLPFWPYLRCCQKSNLPRAVLRHHWRGAVPRFLPFPRLNSLRYLAKVGAFTSIPFSCSLSAISWGVEAALFHTLQSRGQGKNCLFYEGQWYFFCASNMDVRTRVSNNARRQKLVHIKAAL